MSHAVAIIGAGGRMGQEIKSVLQEHSNLQFAAGVDSSGSFFRTVQELPKDIKVVIDFSSPEMLLQVIDWCVRNKIPLVSGTTGISEEHHRALDRAAKDVAVLWAPNMSRGVAVLNELMKTLSALEDFDFQLEESHHRHKKDKPSGTAIHLQATLEKVLGRKLPEVLSIRAGGIFGTHRLTLASEEEVLTLEHTALNRRVFARGAVTAADWLFRQPPGRYGMAEVLGFSDDE